MQHLLPRDDPSASSCGVGNDPAKSSVQENHLANHSILCLEYDPGVLCLERGPVYPNVWQPGNVPTLAAFACILSGTQRQKVHKPRWQPCARTLHLLQSSENALENIDCWNLRTWAGRQDKVQETEHISLQRPRSTSEALLATIAEDMQCVSPHTNKPFFSFSFFKTLNGEATDHSR